MSWLPAFLVCLVWLHNPILGNEPGRKLQESPCKFPERSLKLNAS
jgi:hypothetical protein